MEDIPPHLIAERDELLCEIEEAFGKVTRKGGVSWSETDVIDSYGSDRERKRARGRDWKYGWQDLVDEPSWDPSYGGDGSWAFLDPIGFRYYLPAAMTRCVKTGEPRDLRWLLQLSPREGGRRVLDERWSRLDASQRRCIRRFLRYMVALDEHQDAQDQPDWWEPSFGTSAEEWRKALADYWESAADSG
jgi:hypothetical protein